MHSLNAPVSETNRQSIINQYSTVDDATAILRHIEELVRSERKFRFVGERLRCVDGEWLAGKSGPHARVIPVGTRMAADIRSHHIGYVKWIDRKPVDGIMGRVVEGFRPLRISELPDRDEATWPIVNGVPRDPWQRQEYLVMKLHGGDEVFTFTASSFGATNALRQYREDYARQAAQHPGENLVLELGADKYWSDKFKKWQSVPILTPVAWEPAGLFEAALAKLRGASTSATTALSTSTSSQRHPQTNMPTSHAQPRGDEAWGPSDTGDFDDDIPF